MPVPCSNIFGPWIRVKLDKLDRYAEQMEDYIATAEREYNADIDRRAKLIAEEFRDEFYEDAADGFWELKDVFPNILRRSFFLYAYSFLETELGRVRDYHEKKALGVLPKKGSYISKSRYYLNSIGISFALTDWPKIDGDYRALRNMFAHAAGQLHDPAVRSDIQLLLARLGNAKIEQYEIVIEQEFITRFLALIRRFFAELCSALDAYYKTAQLGKSSPQSIT